MCGTLQSATELNKVAWKVKYKLSQSIQKNYKKIETMK